MKNELFDELLASVQEMDDIVQGKKAAARVTEFPEPEVKMIRGKGGPEPEPLCQVDRCQ